MAKRILSYPFHLLSIAAGAAAAAVVLWKIAPSGAHPTAYLAGLFALASSVDLARRLGLEPADGPAARENRKAR